MKRLAVVISLGLLALPVAFGPGRDRARPAAAQPGALTPLYLPYLAQHDVVAAGDLDSWERITRLAVHSLALDEARGLAWAGTDEGVYRWDLATGEQRRYTKADGLVSDRIGAIAIDPAGNTWFAPLQSYSDADAAQTLGVSRLAPDGTWSAFTRAEGLAHDAVYAIAVDAGGSLWFGTYEGASVLASDGTWRYPRNPNPLLDCSQYQDCRRIVLAIAFDHRGGVWFGSPAGLTHHWGGDRWYESAQDEIRTLATDSGGHAWYTYAFPQTLVQVRSDTHDFGTAFRIPGWGLGEIRAIAIDGQDNKWVAGQEAAGRLWASGAWESYWPSQGLPSDDLRAVAIGSSGLPWFASAGRVSQRRADGSWRSLEAEVRFGADLVRAIAIDRDGRKWFGTENFGGADAGLSSLGPDGTWSHTRARPSSETERIWEIATGRDGTLAAVYFDPPRLAVRWPGAAWQEYPARHFMPDAPADEEIVITGAAVDNLGRVWFGIPNYDGTLAGGIVALSPGGAWQRFTRADGLASDDVKVVAIDHARDRVWAVGTGLSMRGLSAGDWQALPLPTAFEGWAHGMLIDAGGSLWIGSGGSGVFRRDPDGAWSQFTKDDGLPSDDIWSLAEHPDGSLWVATSNGLTRRLPDGTWRSYPIPGSEDPLAYSLRQIFDVEVDGRARVWLATPDGVAVLR